MVRLNLAYRERCIRILYVSDHLFPNLNIPQWHVISCFASGKKVSISRSRCRNVSHHHAAEISLQDPLNSPDVYLIEPVFRVVQSGLDDALWAKGILWMDDNLVKSAQVGRIDEAAQNHQGEASQEEDSLSRLRENHIATAKL
jgi:hypothetical protein